MKLHHTTTQSDLSLNPNSVSQPLTPRKLRSKSFKGLNLTIRKNDSNFKLNSQIPTQDRTKEKSSTSNHFIRNINVENKSYQAMPRRQLFRKNSVMIINGKDMRNKSLPAFNFNKPVSAFNFDKPVSRLNFDKPISAFTTSYKPSHMISYNSSYVTSTKPNKQILNYQDSFSKNPQSISPNFRNYIQTPRVSQEKSFNPAIYKLKNGKLLNFDTSPNKISQQKCMAIKTQPNQYVSPDRINSSIISQLYMIQTPKKQVLKEVSTLKNLRKRITQSILQEGPLTVSSKGKFESHTKQSFEFISALDQKQNRPDTIQNFNKYKQRNLFDQQNQSYSITQKQKEQFFNFTPKVSQEFQLDIYELTESNQKNKNDFSPFWENYTQTKVSEISFTKPVKRRLSLEKEVNVSQVLKQSMILRELLHSLTNDQQIIKKNNLQKNSFDLTLTRKCSENICLARDTLTNHLFGLVKLNKNQRFVEIAKDQEDYSLCLTKYVQFRESVFVEPFQYTLEQIFKMKLVQERRLPQLIQKFHKVINKIKQKVRGGQINLKSLKQRIVYTHGQFKIIPLVDVC